MNWSENEFLAYLLLYVANADANISTEESNYIKQLVKDETYVLIKKEFTEDTALTRTQKIIKGLKNYGYNAENFDLIFNKINQLFNADAHFNSREASMYIFLKQLF